MYKMITASYNKNSQYKAVIIAVAKVLEDSGLDEVKSAAQKLSELSYGSYKDILDDILAASAGLRHMKQWRQENNELS